jgi:hypothetical protein
MTTESLIFIALITTGGQNLNSGNKPQENDTQTDQTQRGGRLRRYFQQLKGGLKEGAHQARVGFWHGGKAGMNKAAKQGKSPTQQMGAALSKGLKTAKQMGNAGADKGSREAREKNPGPITNRDARDYYGKKDDKAARNMGSKEERGGSNNPKAFLNQFKNRSQLYSHQNLNNVRPDLRKFANMNHQAKQQFKQAAKKAVKQGIRQAGRSLAVETGGLSVIAAEAVIRPRTTITIIIILFLLLFMLFDSSTFDPPQQAGNNTPTTSDICNPSQFPTQAFGKTSVCTITVTYGGSAQDITITDTILPGTEFVSAGQNGKYDKASNTVTWDAQQLGFQLNPVDITVTVTVRITSTQNNVKVWNAYSINPVGLSGGGVGAAGGGGTIPSGGNYNLRTWAIALLQGLGIPQSPGAIAAIIHWEQEEGGNWHNQAKYNPLNTTYPEPGSSTFQSVGAGAAAIRIYTSWAQGLDATVKTLKNGNYGGILSALRSGDYNAIGQAVVSSPWGTTQW